MNSSSTCGCKRNNNTMSHPLISGITMGGAIYFLDMLLRPQFSAYAGMEVLLFLIEGAACDVVYSMTGRGSRGLGGFASAFENISLMKSIVAGATLWITDIFLRMSAFNSGAIEMLKFFIQGFIVYFVLSMDMS